MTLLTGGDDYASSTAHFSQFFEDQAARSALVQLSDLPNNSDPPRFSFKHYHPTSQGLSSDSPIDGNIFRSQVDMSLGAAPPRQTSRALSQGRIPRPRNAFMLFRSAFHRTKHLAQAVEKDHRHISRIIAFFWAQLPETEKDVWRQMAEIEKKQHALAYPEYRFKPTPRTKPHAKRNVKRKGPKEIERCHKIATLLRNGKSGEELTHAVRRMESDQSLMVFEEDATSNGGEEREIRKPGQLHLPMYERLQVSQLASGPLHHVTADEPPPFRILLPPPSDLPLTPMKRPYPVGACVNHYRLLDLYQFSPP